MAVQKESVQEINLNSSGSFVRLDIRGYKKVSIQGILKAGSGTWAAAVLTIRRSNDGTNFVALTTASTIGIGGGMSAEVDCSGFAYIAAVVTTPEGGAGLGTITFFAQD